MSDFERIINTGYASTKAEFDKVKKNAIGKVRRVRTDTPGLIMYVEEQ